MTEQPTERPEPTAAAMKAAKVVIKSMTRQLAEHTVAARCSDSQLDKLGLLIDAATGLPALVELRDACKREREVRLLFITAPNTPRMNALRDADEQVTLTLNAAIAACGTEVNGGE